MLVYIFRFTGRHFFSMEAIISRLRNILISFDLRTPGLANASRHVTRAVVAADRFRRAHSPLLTIDFDD